MRRNTITLLKYLVAAGVFIVTGPIALKYLIGRGGDHGKSPAIEVDRGMPRPPREPHDGVKPFDQVPGVQVKQEDKVPELIQEAAAQEDPNEKIDWHDYKQIAEEEQRKGPGEQGQSVILIPEEESKKDALYKVNGFNAFASDKISLDRALKDIRHAECRTKKYMRKLPTASVVIPFHNEHWTTLLRTVHSVINRSPKELMHEIILADDFSTKDFLGKQLDEYLKANYDNVRVVRAKKREGLIRTRLLGARAATGDVLIFLDSHVEAATNWLPPLLEPIALNRKTAVCPFIDVVDYETFAYRAQDEGARGAFDWEFFYKRLPLLPEDLKHPSEPFKSPVMAGGLFAIDRQWFWELGGYDPGLDIWGGEQYELSFKIWQCHGEMVDAPCSRVGHIYRKFAPFPNPGVGDFVGRNYKRVAEVWMDEYKEHLYSRRTHYRHLDPGDITEQLAIREKHKCKSFKWFMEEVAFDLPKYYPPVEPKPVATGEIRHEQSNLCLDTRFKGANERFGIEPCIKDGQGGGEQTFDLTWHKDIRPRKRNVCFDVSQSIAKAPVILFSCHGMKGNQWWKYNADTHQLKHIISNQCLDADGEGKDIYMNPCNPDSQSQKWKFEHIEEAEVRKEWIKD